MFRTLISTAAIALCFASPIVAANDIIPVDKITYGGRYDLATNTFHPSAQDPDLLDPTGTPSVLFNNSTLSGSFTSGSGTIITHHYMDWGTANFGGGGATVTDLRIGYATNVLAPGNITLRVRLYQGATGNGVQGTIIGDYLIAGLPNSASGGFEGYTVDVTLAAPLNIGDGAIGWSYNSDAPATTGPLLVGPPNEAGVVNLYDRYLESTNGYVNTFQFSAPTVASFVMRLTGRANTPPPTAWENYGTKKVINLTGDGPGTPGSNNEVKIVSSAINKPVMLMLGVTQSNIYLASHDVKLLAFPWLIEMGPFVPNPSNGQVLFPFVMPIDAPVGAELFMQSFGQNLSSVWTNHSKGLKLTIQ